MATTMYLESLIALGMRERSDEIMVIFATYIAMSLPFPMAILISACANALLSSMPSPTVFYET